MRRSRRNGRFKLPLSLLKDANQVDRLGRADEMHRLPRSQAPADGADYSSFHFHIEFHPPLRRPNLLKYLAGPEIGGGNFLSDTAPEEKAAELRAQPDLHYKHRLQEQP